MALVKLGPKKTYLHTLEDHESITEPNQFEKCLCNCKGSSSGFICRPFYSSTEENNQ